MKLTFFIFIFFYFSLNTITAFEDCCDHFANDTRCGTFLFEGKKIKNKIQRRIYFDSTGRPKNQAKFNSPKKIFTIHYDTTGIHKVPLIDRNNNGIPDYVDSVAFFSEIIYNIQVNKIGLPDPTNDSLGGGTPGYDIYLLDIGNGDEYPDSNGIQDQGGMYGFTINDLEVYPRTTVPRYTSFIVIDNDFSPTDSARPAGAKPFRVFKTTGIDAMKITVAHEFNHAIQFFIGFEDFGFTGIAEMLSVMFEEICFPEVNDYLQYTRSLFKTPEQYSFAVSNPQNGYRYSIFFMMIAQKYGNEFIKKYFDNLKYGINGYRALDATLISFNSSLNNEWRDFLRWIYHTNFRSVPGNYFKDAEIMPEITYSSQAIFDKPAVTIASSIEPYQLRADRVIFTNPFPLSNDTLNIITSHIDSTAPYYQVFLKDDFVHSIIDETRPDYQRIFLNSAQNYYYNLKSVRNKTVSALFEIPSVNTVPLASAYPNPVFTNEAKYIYFPVYHQSKIGDFVELTIFNSNMLEIFRYNLPVSVISNNRVLVFNFEDFRRQNQLATGVYIFNAKSPEGSLVGKFSVINN